MLLFHNNEELHEFVSKVDGEKYVIELVSLEFSHDNYTKDIAKVNVSKRFKGTKVFKTEILVSKENRSYSYIIEQTIEKFETEMMLHKKYKENLKSEDKIKVERGIDVVDYFLGNCKPRIISVPFKEYTVVFTDIYSDLKEVGEHWIEKHDNYLYIFNTGKSGIKFKISIIKQ